MPQYYPPPLRLGLPSDLFPSGFPINILYAFLFVPRRVQVMKLLIMQFSLTSCHLTPLRSKYSPQHSPGMDLPLYIIQVSLWVRVEGWEMLGVTQLALGAPH
jgi:hypothetical protein